MDGPCQPNFSVNVNMTHYEYSDLDDQCTVVPEDHQIEYDGCGLCEKYCGSGDKCDKEKEKKKTLQDERAGLTKFELKYHTFSTEKTLATSWVRHIPTVVIGCGLVSVVSILLGRPGARDVNEDEEDESESME